MGRKGQKKGKGGEQSGVVTEAVRIRVAKILEQFRVSDDQVYTFEPSLSNQERAAIHVMCRKMGMISRSSGNGEKRRLSVYKSKKNQSSLKKEEDLVACLRFSEETDKVLQDLFTRFPPQDEELNSYGLRSSTESADKGQWKKDSSFCKPSIRKSEIAKKVEMLQSKVSESAQLRKVAEDREKLPIASYRDVITSTLENHQVVLISGETGCGKTTQVPQYILDHMWGKGESCKIICTQPRRISAISVAERIAYERGETVGENVGYKIRLESKGGKQSSILFCTNGVLLRLLISRGSNLSKSKTLNRSKEDPIQGITHIIVDEIHERDRFSDFMLAIIRDLLPAYPHLRMVLMSATIDADRFSRYFGGCPIIRVPGFTFAVKVFYLEDVLSILSSADESHLNRTDDELEKDSSLTEDFKNALDESIDLALSSDEFDPLLGLISTALKPSIYNYRHSSSGVSPLMVLGAKGRVGDVCMLLSLGADCCLCSKDGRSALDWAAEANEVEVFEIIKRHVENDKSKSSDQEELTNKYLASINPENIDTVLIVRLLKRVCSDSTEGAILVFLPGWDDINQTKEKLVASSFFQDPSKFVILSLHSMIPSAEQKKVFKRSPAGVRKIILSTNIAETAVTIDDVIYVIDTGRMKEKSYDPYNNVSTLQSSWVSKASARQREGRAGRCQPGTCYHLYSRVRAASLPDYQVPEIKRMPIEELCLQVKLLDPQCQIIDFLQKTLDPPVPESIRNAINVLKDIGALTENEELTDIGEKLGSLPVHPSTSKMLLFAILLNCLDPALTLACSADYREPFLLPMAPDQRKRAAAAKVELSSLFGGYSDQLAVVAAFDCWMRAKERGQESQFCSRYFVSSSTMNMLCGMRKQLQNELAKNGFIPNDVSTCSLNAHDSGIVRAVLMAGNYPMVGRLLPRRKDGKRAMVETASGAKVRLHQHSSNFNLPCSKFASSPLIIYDEITRGDGGMYIRNSSLVGPWPLFLLATEMAVAPVDNNGSESDEDEDTSSYEDMEINTSSEQHGKEIMSSPDNTVSAVVDRWLRFKATALNVAQIYCLRERLAAAILFKIKYPSEYLPPELGQSVYAIACILSYDGMPSMFLDNETTEPPSSAFNEADKGRYAKRTGFRLPSGFLKSLISNKGQPSVPHKIRAPAHGKSFSSAGRTYAPLGPTLQPTKSLQVSTSGGSTSRTGSVKRRR